MKKFGLLLICMLIFSTMLTGCNYKPKQKQPTINYTRRLEKYMSSESGTVSTRAKTGNAIDLSEGPQLKYDAKFGPGDMNFDVKVVNPYNF